MDASRRLDLALRDLGPGDWESFERLCSTFLSEEFPGLKVIAGTGDKGRDAVLESVDHAGVVFQFSIEEDPRSKILRTVTRLKEARIAFHTLIYMTNQEVGPRGDKVQAQLFADGINLLVRDRSYFVSRALSTSARAAASEALAKRVVDPVYIGEAGTGSHSLDDPALRAGLLYLELQLHDSQGGRNISKLTYDALVLSALSSTDAQNQRTRAEIRTHVRHLIPNHDRARVEASVDGSLQRLRSRGRVTFTGAEDSFGLHYDERTRLAAKAAEIADARAAVRVQFEAIAERVSEDLEIPLGTLQSDDLADAIDYGFQAFLQDHGNRFAEAVRDKGASLKRRETYSTAEAIVISRQQQLRKLRLPLKALSELISEVMRRCFVASSEPVQLYLRELSDAYTLLAFLREAEDVQDAVGHFFSRGTLVLDTTVVLPCIAETTLEEGERRFTWLFEAARRSGMRLYITDGVLNEINAHLRRCISCLQIGPSEWIGEIPLVLAEWQAGGADGDFRTFVNQFTSRDGSLDRIELFTREALGIDLVDLGTHANRVPIETRGRIAEIWRERKRVRETDSELERTILLRHDVEAYCGVLGMRRGETADIYGYESWWVTTDGTAYRMKRLLAEEGITLQSDPCMAPVFLSNLIALGGDSQLETDTRMRLPTALDIHRAEWMGGKLGEVADRIRAEHADAPVWLVRSKTREAVNEIKGARSELIPTDEAQPDLPVVSRD